jgi:phosphotriesterase-related protein
MDEKIIRAAMETHRQTGLAIVSHSGQDGPAFAQLNIMKAESFPLDAFIWTHSYEGTPDGRLKAAKMGAWISLDYIHRDEIDKNIEMISHLKDAGYLHRLLISHDAGWYDPAQPGGGEFRGYEDIFKYLIPALKKEGYTQQEIDQLLIENPKEAYAVRDRKK